MRKQPYTEEQIETMINCLIENGLLDSDDDADIGYLAMGFYDYVEGRPTIGKKMDLAIAEMVKETNKGVLQVYFENDERFKELQGMSKEEIMVKLKEVSYEFYTRTHPSTQEE